MCISFGFPVSDRKLHHPTFCNILEPDTLQSSGINPMQNVQVTSQKEKLKSVEGKEGFRLQNSPDHKRASDLFYSFGFVPAVQD
jgi:hypothetical protein